MAPQRPKKASTPEAPKKLGRPPGLKSKGRLKEWKLSKELAAIVGSDVMPRSQVSKKMWAVIKERELQDPDKKQFTICDAQLFKVFGVKRFSTFGMMKYLKNHFIKV